MTKTVRSFHKLVRDRIPEIIRSTGSTCTMRKLKEDEYIEALRVKLREELDEFLVAETSDERVEEAADILEVLYTLLDIEGRSMQEVEAIRISKAKSRGAFEKRLFLLETEKCDHG